MEDALFIVDIIISISLLALTIVSLLKQGYKSSLNRIFAGVSFLIATFIISSDISNNINLSSQVSLYANFVSFSSASALAIALMQFVSRLASIRRIEELVNKVLLPLWVITAISATPLVAESVEIQGHIYAVNYGPMVWLFALGVLTSFSILTYAMVQGLKHSRGVKKRQLASTGIGLLVTLPLVLLFSLIIPLSTGIFTYNIFSTAPIMALVISLYYGVVRYHLFDIRSAAVRTLAYVLSLVVLIITYYAFIVIISSLFEVNNIVISQNPLNVGLGLSLLFVFQPIKKFFDKLTNSIFYRDYYSSDEFFGRLNRLFTSTGDLRSLLERTSSEVADTIKSEQGFMFVHTRDDHYITAGTQHHRRPSIDDIMLLQKTYGKKKDVIVASMLADDDVVRKMMISHRIELILPLVQNDIIGYLFLGEHKTSQYTIRDVKVLGTVADSLVIAVQNTLSIKEIQDINDANTQQHITDATKELRVNNILLHKIDEEKDEFISIASHEIRTPITVVRGYIGMLESEQTGSINEAQKGILEKISLNTKTLINLIDDMLDLSKLETGKLKVKLSENSLDDLVKKSIETMKLMYDNKGLKLNYSGVNAVVITDPDKFERIMLNLLSNAYKFTLDGGSVSITSTTNQSERTVTICITDTGIGIPAKFIGDLFKRFSQIDNYLQKQSSGTGLGLAICKQLVEKLGGKIWAESKPGAGSKFYFTIPISDTVPIKA